MRNFNFNWMKNAAKNTQTTGGGTSRRCEDANQSRIASDPIPCRYRVDTVSVDLCSPHVFPFRSQKSIGFSTLPCFGYTPGISGLFSARVWKYAAMIFAVLVMSMANVGTAWGAVYKTYALSDLTYTSATLTYEVTGLSSNDQKLNKGERKVEVPCASASGTLYLSGTSANADRYASIWGSNGTAVDASRKIAMTSGYGSGISFTSADILTEGGKYYIIFSNVDDSDYKINAFKYVLSSACGSSTKRIYMKAGAWNTDSPYFYAHSWGSSNSDVLMTLAGCETDVFYADIPSGNTSVLFTRQSTNSGIKYKNETGNWNQSADITISTNDKFTFSAWDGGDGKSTFTGGTYSAPTYTISYAANSGSGSMSSQTSIACGTDKATTANTFTRSGYIFTGWHADVDVTVGGANKTAGTLLADGVTIQNVSSNITLTAQWEEAATYSVTYNANGATGSVPTDASSPYSTGATVTVLGKNTLAKTDNGFAGWRTAASSGTWYVQGQTFTMGSANVNLYAQWVPEANLVSGTLYQAADLKSAALTSTSAESDRYRAGISSNGVSEILGTGIANATAGPMEYNTISSTTVGDASFTSVLYFKGAGSGSPSATGTTIPTSRSIKFRVPSKGTLHLYVKGPGSISLIKSGGTAAVIGSGDANAYVTADVTAGTYYLFATASSRSLYGLKFVEESCSATQPGALSKGTLSGCSRTITASGSAATNNTWYWQSSASGTDKSDAYSTGKAITEAGTYYLRSYCTTGSGCWSEAVQVTITAADMTPAAPTALAAASPTAKGVTLTVTDAANTNDYEFYVSTSDDDPDGETTATHSVTSAKSLTITNLYAGTTFYAWARAKCGSNKSAWTALGDGGTFTTSTVTVTHTLTNVTKSSGATSGVGGSDYEAVYEADEDYALPTPSVTIGGNTATSGTDYTWTSGTGTISIPAEKITGDIVITMNSAATAPTNVAISGAYHYYPGETISLTATATGGNGPKTYQWYHGGKADGDAIDGATSATFSKTCVVGDAGSYYCKVTCGGSASRWSDGASQDPYNVKVMQFYLKNSGGSDISNHALQKVDATHATLPLSLTGGTTYKFRVTDGCGNWYGNDGEMTSSNCTDWTMKDDADCRITTSSKSATYTFNFDFTDGLLGKEMKVSVVYPAGNQAADKVIYWDNSVLNWASAPWYRIGKSTHNNKTQMTLVPGTANLYAVTTTEYNGFEYWHIANNQGQGTGNIFWTKDNSEGSPDEITNAMGFEGSPVTADAVTFTPTLSHGTGGSSDNNNCEFYEYGQQNGMKTDRVTISSYSNGTITVNYVDTDDEAASFTSGYEDLAHTVVLTSITAVANTGYDAGAITINGGAYSANYEVTGATTIAASFTPQTYSITYKDKGGSSFSGTHADGYPTTHTYATATALETATKTGYTFGGWYTSVDCSTGLVTSLGATDYTADITLYAKWTADTYTITLNKGDHGAANQSATVAYDATALTSITHVTSTGYDRTGYFDGSTKVLDADGSFADNDITGYITDGKWSKTADASLTAKWDAQSYTISYKDQGDETYSGSNLASLPTSHTYGAATDFVNGVKSGYRFLGWYTDASCTISAGSSIGATAITANTTYYAKWAQLYAITNGSPANGTITVASSAAAGDVVDIEATPSSGYVFDGWNIYKTGTPATTVSPAAATASTTFTMPAYDVTVNASFVVQTYELSYDKGTGATGSASGGSSAGSYAEGTTITVPAQGTLANTGYTFRGWTDGTTFYLAGQSFSMPAGNVTLTAVWEAGETTVTLSWFDTSQSNSSGSPKKPDDLGKYLYGYTSSTMTSANALTMTMANTNTKGVSGNGELLFYYTDEIRIYADNTTTGGTPTSFSNVTSVAFKADQYNSSSTTRTTNYAILVGTDTIGKGSIVGKHADGWKVIKVSTDTPKNGYVKIKLGGSGTNCNLYIDSIAITTKATSSNYTVAFDNKTGFEGTTTLPDTIKGVPTGKKILQPTDPTATGYTFDKWVTTSGGSTPFSFSGTITKDTTIYASWTANTYDVAVTLTDSKATQESGDTGTGAATHGTDYVATFEAVSGYALPSDVTVSIGGDTKTKDTEYTWSITDGVGELTIDGDAILGNIAITVTASVAKTDPTVYELSGTTSVCEGDEATLTLDDSDDGVTYALYLDGVDKSDDKVGDGNAITWTVTADGTYTVSAKADATYNAADMDGSAVISYKTATAIGTQPTTEVSGHDGVNFTLGTGLVATGQGELSYKWYSYSNAGGEGQAEVGGATSATYTTSKSAGTYYYKVEVTAACGSAKSNMITVTVDNQHLLTYDANGGSDAPDAEYRAAGSAALSVTEPTRSNYRFLGWNTENDGTGDHYDAGASFTMGTSAVILYAEWGETATLTWTLTTGTGESSVSTSSKTSTNTTRISTSNMSNLSNSGLTITNNSKTSYTVKIEAPSSKDDDKYMYVTFVVADDYELVPSAVTATFQPVDAAASADMILSDTHGHSISLLGASCSKGDPNEKTITNDGDVAFSGTVTLKIYCYGSSVNTYRLGSTITVTGDINYICPERATITSPTAPQSIKLYTDQSKTLSVSATAYAGTLNYQWQKDGEDIDGATSATYTVVGSGLTAGTTYKYTCNVSETSPASCATVTSPAFNVKAASTDCGDVVIAGVTATSKNSGTPEGSLIASSSGYKVNLQDWASPDGGCGTGGKIGGDNNYIYLTLKSGEYFQDGDKVIVDIAKVPGTGDSKLHIYDGTTTLSDESTMIGTSGTPTCGENEIVLSGVPANTSSITLHRGNGPTSATIQNPYVISMKVKRYGCPDIYVYDNAAATDVWSDEDNWIGPAGHGSGLPTIDDRAIITKPITVDIAHATASEVRLDQSSSNTGSLTIQANKGLEVAGKVQVWNGSALSATTPSDLLLESSSAGNATLIFDNSNSDQATVQMYSKGWTTGEQGGGTWNWQTVGVPVTDATRMNDYYGGYMYEWSSSGWVDKTDMYGALTPFTAYSVSYPTGDAEHLHTYSIDGTLVATGDKSISIPANTSVMALANSWTAPIHISDIEFTSEPANIFLYNTGYNPKGSAAGKGEVSGDRYAAGTYLCIPKNSAPYLDESYIAPMQGFYVKNKLSSAGTITINYNTVVRPSSDRAIVSGAMHAPKRTMSNLSEPAVLKMYVSDSQHDDRLVLLEREDFSRGFDNGWDGEKFQINAVKTAPRIFAINETGGKESVSAIPELENTVIGFRPGKEETYTIRFEYNGDETLYLRDTRTGAETLITNESEYVFLSDGTNEDARFIIVRVQSTPTGTEEIGAGSKAYKLMIEDHIYIIRDGRMYSVDGALVNLERK